MQGISVVMQDATAGEHRGLPQQLAGCGAAGAEARGTSVLHPERALPRGQPRGLAGALQRSAHAPQHKIQDWGKHILPTSYKPPIGRNAVPCKYVSWPCLPRDYVRDVGLIVSPQSPRRSPRSERSRRIRTSVRRTCLNSCPQTNSSTSSSSWPTSGATSRSHTRRVVLPFLP